MIKTCSFCSKQLIKPSSDINVKIISKLKSVGFILPEEQFSECEETGNLISIRNSHGRNVIYSYIEIDNDIFYLSKDLDRSNCLLCRVHIKKVKQFNVYSDIWNCVIVADKNHTNFLFNRKDHLSLSLFKTIINFS